MKGITLAASQEPAPASSLWKTPCAFMTFAAPLGSFWANPAQCSQAVRALPSLSVRMHEVPWALRAIQQARTHELAQRHDSQQAHFMHVFAGLVRPRAWLAAHQAERAQSAALQAAGLHAPVRCPSLRHPLWQSAAFWLLQTLLPFSWKVAPLLVHQQPTAMQHMPGKVCALKARANSQVHCLYGTWLTGSLGVLTGGQGPAVRISLHMNLLARSTSAAPASVYTCLARELCTCVCA